MSSPASNFYESQPPLRGQLLTWANLATTLRLVLGLAAFCIALVERNPTWNFIGLGIYWSLDIADGWLARRFKQETLFGAQYDILADRIQVAFFYLIYAGLHPDKIPVITVFLLQFMVFDHYLSNQFLRWKLISPNYFYRVDKHIFDLLWSPLGKAANTGLVTMLIILIPSMWPALVVTLVLIGVRIHCGMRVMGLPVPRLPEQPHPARSEPVKEAAAKADDHDGAGEPLEVAEPGF